MSQHLFCIPIISLHLTIGPQAGIGADIRADMNKTLAALKQPRGSNKATLSSVSSSDAAERPATRWELRNELKQLRKELNERETRATGEARFITYLHSRC